MADEQTHITTTGIIILAAGASSRLGSPKQLLTFSGTTLLQHSIEMAQSSDAANVLVVLGANAALIQTEINYTTANVFVNPGWKEGMASSIRCGLQLLVKTNPQVEAAIFMVSDQPFVTAALLNQLMDAHRTNGSKIVAAKYQDTFGTPVLFHKTFFPELLQLNGDVGAKSVVRKHLNEVTFFPFPKGHIDIDTIDDYNNLSNEE